MAKIKFRFRNQTTWLETDENQWIVHEGFIKSIINDRVVLKRKNPSYLKTLDSAVWFIAQHQIRQSDAKTLKKLHSDVKQIKKNIDRELGLYEGRKKRNKA